nr:ribokinase [Quercus suber]
MSRKAISVIGSLNVDFITRTPRLPAGGETLTATSFTTGFGGKGANQAVACARLAPPEVHVSMVGNVGSDTFGSDYLAALEKEGIDASRVRRLEGFETGIANIIVEESTGENRILLATGANYAFAEEQDEGWEMVNEDGEDVVVMQLEIPLRVVLHNLEKASRSGKHVIMNPAPAVQLPVTVFPFIDTLVMNETESEILAGHRDESSTPVELAKWFLQQGVKDAVIITLGGDGLVYATASGASGTIAAQKVNVVDTTAAGDTFVGAFAVQRARQAEGPFSHEEALKHATLAASKTVERRGAMAAIPYLNEL